MRYVCSYEFHASGRSARDTRNKLAVGQLVNHKKYLRTVKEVTFFFGFSFFFFFFGGGWAEVRGLCQIVKKNPHTHTKQQQQQTNNNSKNCLCCTLTLFEIIVESRVYNGVDSTVGVGEVPREILQLPEPVVQLKQAEHVR